ncbi:MAG: hypothetical protein EOO73_05275 [Myxococcales bacterium]|nr:MAG: hypothetical protein EOO73_05275 [Myxococcales bacterium]
MNANIEQKPQTQKQQAPDPRTDIQEIGMLGFIIFDGTGYYYVMETDWQALQPEAIEPQEGVLVAVQDGGETLFVNLDLVGEAPTKNT